MLRFAILGDFVQTPEFKIDPQLLKILQSTDFNIANLEAPFISDNDKPANGQSGLYQKVSDCQLLHDLNVQCVSLANNHICDFGLDGLLRTQKILDDNGIKYFGAGKSSKEASAAAVLEKKGVSISCRGFMSRYLTRFHAEESFGSVDTDLETMLKSLCNDTADIKIVYNHWNQEFEDYPEPIYKENAEDLCTRADVVAGSHSHCMQGVQSVNGRPVFHSLGNFSLPNISYYQCEVSPYRPKSYWSFFPLFTFDGKRLHYEIIPFSISANGAELSIADEDTQKKIVEKIHKISLPLSFDKKNYLKFYRKHRERKMRKPLTRDHKKNLHLLKSYRMRYKVFHGLEKGLANTLDHLGLRKTVKRLFKPLVEHVQKRK